MIVKYIVDEAYNKLYFEIPENLLTEEDDDIICNFDKIGLVEKDDYGSGLLTQKGIRVHEHYYNTIKGLRICKL
jgi:hypothetical protein